MTDNEIIKALECCKVAPQNCDNCPMLNAECQQGLPKVALDLVNRQQAEIENYSHNIKNLTAENMQLQSEIERLYNTRVTEHSVQKQLSKAKAEASKEFAERLKEKAYLNDRRIYVVLRDDIDSLAKEMAGETE